MSRATGKARRTPSARSIAASVLDRVLRQDAWAGPALDAELRRARPSSREAALATELVYGTLRVLPALQAGIDARSRRPGRMDPWVRVNLLLGAYQLRHMAGVPPYAAVSESVALVRARRGQGPARFVNAVLRRLAEHRPERPAPPERLVVPAWLAQRLREALGPDRAEDYLRRAARAQPLGLRVTSRCPGGPEGLRARILAERPEARCTPGTLLPGALRLHHAGDPRKLPGYAEGHFAVQEEGSQAVAEALVARPGERVLDACAGHGGKSLLLAERVGPPGRLVALDVDERKLERIAPESDRLGIATSIEHHAVDLTVGTGPLSDAFDRVLVDAPCTNVGTLGRRPERLLRLAPTDAARMAEQQLAILTTAARLVRPGGLLLYAVCSPDPTEGRDVALAFEQAHRGQWRRRAAEDWPLGLRPDAAGIVLLGPEHDTDLFQLAAWVRT